MSASPEQAMSFEALLSASRRASEGLRHRPAVARFLMDRERECLRLARALRLPADDPDTWRPGPARRFVIHDPKRRLITVVPFADRVVHHALCAAIEPALERYAVADSYACRKGRGQFAAIDRVRRFVAASPWAIKADVRAYFASIPHDRLLAALRRRVRDGYMCELLERIVRAPHLSPSPGRGLPIGTLTSQHLANLYLGRLDHWIKDELGVRRYARYMDDMVICGDRAAMRELLPRLNDFLRCDLDLELNRERSCVLPTRDGVPFLGVRIYAGLVRVRPARWRRFRRRHRALERALAEGRIGEEALAASMTSQFAHLAHFDSLRLRQAHLARLQGGWGTDHDRREPCSSRRLLEHEPAERAGRESQQERAVEAQRQRRLSRGELSAAGYTGLRAGDPRAWPDGGGSRTAILRPGADPAGVPCSGQILKSGTETQRSGGGPGDGVAAGPSFGAGD